MNDFLYMETYTPEELKKAEKQMTLEDAYAVVSEHYITLNYKKELKKAQEFYSLEYLPQQKRKKQIRLIITA